MLQPTTKLDTVKSVLVLGIYEEDAQNYRVLSPILAKEIDQALEQKLWKKEFGEKYVTRLGVGVHRVLLLGLGKREEMTLERLRKLMHKSLRYARAKKADAFSTNIVQLVAGATTFSAKDLGRAAAEGLVLSQYSFKKYQTKENNDVLIREVAALWKGDTAAFMAGVKEGLVIAEATNFARDLVNEPAVLATPLYLESVAKALAKHPKIKLKVLDDHALEKEGLHALLSVSLGSDLPARLLILEYNGMKTGPQTALVGKGITFDTGGYSLKPSSRMLTMKSDMGGGAAVLATIKAAASLGLKQRIIAVVPTCENAVNGSAMKLGDVLEAYNKKTIEVTNTDAEGRLVLADGMSYVEEKYKPEILIDVATLTGSARRALGNEYAALISTDAVLRAALLDAGEQSFDRAWALPFPEEYLEIMKSPVADLRNSSGDTAAGAITAAVFLSHFVDKARWAHLDIAPTAFTTDGRNYFTKGGTGAGVRLLLYYFLKKA